MGCDECDKNTQKLDEDEDEIRFAYVRAGNEEVGYGSIAVVGCDEHIKWTLEQLRKAPIDGRKRKDKK